MKILPIQDIFIFKNIHSKTDDKKQEQVVTEKMKIYLEKQIHCVQIL